MEQLTMNKNGLSREINATLAALIQELSLVPDNRINVIPFEGSWTAGQLAQHMIMSNGGFADILVGPIVETDRDPAKLIDDIRNTFLNFSIKFESPDFIVPPKIDYTKEELLSSLQNIKEKVDHATKTSDLSKTCVAFELPGLGFLTRLEAIHFVLYHTQRHIHQLKNIRNALNN